MKRNLLKKITNLTLVLFVTVLTCFFIASSKSIYDEDYLYASGESSSKKPSNHLAVFQDITEKVDDPIHQKNITLQEKPNLEKVTTKTPKALLPAEIILEDSQNIINLTNIEDSESESLDISGLYKSDISIDGNRCLFEMVLKLNYVHDAKLPPEGMWDYKVMCNQKIVLSDTGSGKLKGHLKMATDDQKVLTNPSSYKHAIKFEILSETEIDFTVYTLEKDRFKEVASSMAIRD